MSLSEKSFFGGVPQFTSQAQMKWYQEKDVREAVKELKEYLLHNAEVNRDHCITFIDEIFGEKLI